MKHQINQSRRGTVTMEMIASCLFIVVPCILGLSQLCMLDRTARELQYAAQEKCLKAAIAGDEDPSFRIISSSSSIRFSALPEAVSCLGRLPSRTLKRQYVIATGSGYGNE